MRAAYLAVCVIDLGLFLVLTCSWPPEVPVGKISRPNSDNWDWTDTSLDAPATCWLVGRRQQKTEISPAVWVHMDSLRKGLNHVSFAFTINFITVYLCILLVACDNFKRIVLWWRIMNTITIVITLATACMYVSLTYSWTVSKQSDVFTPYKKPFRLVFWEKEWL